ncbi:MAG TPA: hypothetical protein VIJ46_05370 [Rhabdochlamydiaceae bacterium]
MNFLSWSSKQAPAPLSTEQASNMLKTLGTIDKEQIAKFKLSFCDTDIAWMTSSGTVRSLWSALNTVHASSWSCDLKMLPTLADKITQVYTTELAKIETSKQAADTVSLFADAIVGLDTLKACHYETKEAKSQLVTLAVESLVRLRDQVLTKKGELERKEAPVVAPAPVVLTPIQDLEQRYNAFRERYLALKSRIVAKATQGGVNFTKTNDFSAAVKQQEAEQIAGLVPAESPDDDAFNMLREKFIQLVKLDRLLVIEGEGYGVTR